jgi:hypothetical protein
MVVGVGRSMVPAVSSTRAAASVFSGARPFRAAFFEAEQGVGLRTGSRRRRRRAHCGRICSMGRPDGPPLRPTADRAIGHMRQERLWQRRSAHPCKVRGCQAASRGDEHAPVGFAAEALSASWTTQPDAASIWSIRTRARFSGGSSARRSSLFTMAPGTILSGRPVSTDVAGP